MKCKLDKVNLLEHIHEHLVSIEEKLEKLLKNPDLRTTETKPSQQTK